MTFKKGEKKEGRNEGREGGRGKGKKKELNSLNNSTSWDSVASHLPNSHCAAVSLVSLTLKHAKHPLLLGLELATPSF